MSNREYLIAPWIRLWHWTNALLIMTLGTTGLSLHFASPAFQPIDFALAVRIHNTAGVLLIATYLFFVVDNIVTGNWWQFVPKPPGILQRILVQARWYAVGIFLGEPHPHEPSKEEHFNALQAITYWRPPSATVAHHEIHNRLSSGKRAAYSMHRISETTNSTS